MSEFTVRIAEAGDYQRIGELTCEAYAADGHIPEDYDYAKVLRAAADRAEHAVLYAVVEGHSVLGTVTYCPPGSGYAEIAAAGEGEFRMLAVAPAARRRGVAEALVRAMLTRAAEDGIERLVLSSAVEMNAAHRLYERLGFQRAPARDWYPLPGHRLLVYESRRNGPTG